MCDMPCHGMPFARNAVSLVGGQENQVRFMAARKAGRSVQPGRSRRGGPVRGRVVLVPNRCAADVILSYTPVTLEHGRQALETEIFRSDRLRIRRWTEEDIPRLFAIYSDPRVSRFLPMLHAESLEEVAARHPRLMDTYVRYGPGYGAWAAERLSDGHVVGTVLLKHLPGFDDTLTEDIEVGWHLGSDSWGQGYATEMGAAAIRYGFEIQGLDRIYALADPENEASIAVMRRLGMRWSGLNHAYYGGERAEVYVIDASSSTLTKS